MVDLFTSDESDASDNEEIKSISTEPPDESGLTLPIVLGDKVISDNDHWYVIRITPDVLGDIPRGNLLELMKEIGDIYWAYCDEVGRNGKPHWHIVVLSDKGLKSVKGLVKNALNQIYSVWSKADGNKRSNTQLSKDVTKALTYITKDKKYYCGPGVNMEFLKACQNDSFVKDPKNILRDKLKALKLRFIADEIDSKRLRGLIFQAYADVDICVSRNHVTELVDKYNIQKDPEYAFTI